MSSDLRLFLFQNQKAELDAKRLRAETLVRLALESAGVSFQSISSRLKSEDSLRSKLARPDKTYETLWDVTDLVGIRIVTFFEDSIDEIASLIERTFAIDYQRSTNKLASAEHDRFGYRSLHYICFLKDDPQFRFEIQIRTILQHAWAEIEHDLGYKAGDLAPSKMRRRFSRLAGLLEIADQEFVSIRRELNEYVKSVNENLSGSTSAAGSVGSAIELDAISVLSLLDQADVVSADKKIAQNLNASLSSETFFPAYLVKMLRAAGLRGVGETLERLRLMRSQTEKIEQVYFEVIDELWQIRFDSGAELPRGYSLILLAHAVILSSESLALNRVARLAHMYATVDQSYGALSPLDVANRFVDRLEKR